MVLTGKNIIGRSLTAAGSIDFYAENPATRKTLEPTFYEATPQEIAAAIEKATQAFQQYRNKTGSERAEFLEAIATEIMAVGDQLIYRCMEESGLAETRLKNERNRTVNQLKLFAQYLREGSWLDARIDKADSQRSPARPDIRSMEKALGPVGVFGASNFPLAFSVAGGDTVSALAAGCPVIFKAHPSHPGTCEIVGTAILHAAEKTRMPEGTFSLLHGKATRVGQAIVKHPEIKAIGFTGSYAGGKALFDAANSRAVPIPVFAEMGSTNPVFILPGALKERKDAIARDLANSVTLGVGQFCTEPGVIIISDIPDGKGFIEMLAGCMKESAPGIMLNASIQQNYNMGVERLSKSNGVHVLAKGEPKGEGYEAAAYFFHTTAEAFLNDHTLEEEVFGPSTLAVSASSSDELMRIAHGLKGHLTATIHGTEKDLELYRELLQILEQKVGRLIINGYPTGVEVTHAMVHGGPFPATTDPRTTSVGSNAIRRFTRPVCYQNFPPSLLPPELQDANPLNIWRLVDGEWSKG